MDRWEKMNEYQAKHYVIFNVDSKESDEQGFFFKQYTVFLL